MRNRFVKARDATISRKVIRPDLGMFTIISSQFAFDEGDPRRIAAAVVTGVGLLGATLYLSRRSVLLYL